MNYAMEFRGCCLGPSIPDKALAIVNPSIEIEPGTFCGVFPRKDTYTDLSLRDAFGWMAEDDDGGPFGLCKIFLNRIWTGTHELLLLGQIWPTGIAVVPVINVEAFHAIVDFKESIPEAAKSLDATKVAITLLEFALGANSSDPINPDWHPPFRAPAGEKQSKQKGRG